MNNNPFDIKQGERIEVAQCRFAGVHLPRQIASHLTLLSIYYQEPKSNIIRSAIKEKLKREESITGILQNLANRAFAAWKLEKAGKKRTKEELQAHYKEYRAELVTTLERRTMPKEHIKLLMEALDRATR